MKKDILFLCQYFYPEYVSSATLPYDIAKDLADKGYSVGAICGFPYEYSDNKNIPKEETVNGVEIRRVRYTNFSKRLSAGRIVNYLTFLVSILFSMRRFKDYKVIFIFSNPPVLPVLANIASKIYGNRLVFVSYDIYPEIAIATNSIKKNGFIHKVMSSVNRSFFRRASKVVAISDDMKRKIREVRPEFNPDNIEVIHNWYEGKTSEVSPREILKTKFPEIDLDKDIVVSYLGNLGIAQDHETLAAAVRYFNKHESNIKFLFAGHGHKFKLLKEDMEKENYRNVVVRGFLHGQDYEDALAISDVLIVTLADGVSGLAVPSKFYSYLYSGKPVISIMDEDTDIARMLRANNAGYSIGVGDKETLIEILGGLTKESLEVKKGNSRKLFEEHYTKEISLNKYSEMVRKLIEEINSENVYEGNNV